MRHEYTQTHSTVRGSYGTTPNRCPPFYFLLAALEPIFMGGSGEMAKSWFNLISLRDFSRWARIRSPNDSKLDANAHADVDADADSDADDDADAE